MHLSPSDIHFLKDYLTECLTPDESLLTTLSDRFLSATELPKVQVVERNGAWFALNSASLHVFRALQRRGKCVRIRVEVVPLSKVPKSVQESMVVELTSDSSSQVDGNSNSKGQSECICTEKASPSNEGSSGKATKRGYHKLCDGWKGDDVVPHQDSETEGTSTDYSDYDHEKSDEESDSEFDESLTCNVCDRSFASTRLLAQHQQRKRHFGCSVCDSIFPNLMTLELHKESLEHWSDDDDDDDDDNVEEGRHSADESDEDDDIQSPTEELERLL